MGRYAASSRCLGVRALRVAACATGLLHACSTVDDQRFDGIFGGVSTSKSGIQTADDQHDAGSKDAEVSSNSVGVATSDADATRKRIDEGCATGKCWWSEDEAVCGGVGVPTESTGPPVETESEGPDVGPIYLGWSKVWLGESPRNGSADDLTEEELASAWAGFGFDLDDTCTNPTDCDGGPEDAVSCKSATAELPFDGDRCRDNTYARYHPLVAQSPALGAVFGLTEAHFNCSLHRGDYTQVIRVSDYNGQPNDAEVRVDYYYSPGLLVPPSFWDCPEEDFADKRPRWKASAEWYVDAADLTAEVATPGKWPESKRSATSAYVRDGYLVALSDEFRLNLNSDNAPLRGWSVRVLGAVLTGKLQEQRDGTWSLAHGLLGGRVLGEDMFAAWHELGVCPDGVEGSLSERIHTFTTQGLDVLSDGKVDPDKDCDAMSFGAGFAAHQIKPGPATDTPVRLDCCEPENEGAPGCPASCGDGQITGEETCDTGIPEGEEGACPTECPAAQGCTSHRLTGSDCQTECTEEVITEVKDDDGCCPGEGSDTTDNDCRPRCGNGVVDPGETCDPPDSCPTAETCTSTDACSPATLRGDPTMCTSECVEIAVDTCTDGDMCCGPGCDPSNDDDCGSPTCGNGMVDLGEICDGDCPTSCEDGDACTADVLIGEANLCTSRCYNFRIVRCAGGDGCCPPLCTALNDNDC